ncbi:F0F1 ATP synthase subunit A [Candidatus Kaiserbacteria bacterium]|nr:F0F1 ATP synthase subunit A [Candidatus Kaiserbacteria bacterium]
MESGIHVALAPETITTIFGLPITNTLLTSWAVILVLFVIAIVIGRNPKLIPGRFQLLLEWLFGFVYDYIAETLESREYARCFFPYLVTIFLFVFTSNLLEFTPGIGSVGFFGDPSASSGHATGFTPLLRSVNTDLNVTLMLAILSFLVIEISGILAIGAWKYAGKFINFRGPIAFFVGIVEFFSEIARIVSFSFRLFGNIFAGEVLILVVTYFLPVVAPVPIMAFEVFVGFVQAAIFALLTLFFIKLAIAEPH